jgi:hypothetical protein
MSSDEQNVAQVGKELLDASGIFTGYQVAVAETDAELTLPAVIVMARHAEDTQIIFNGMEMKRYALTTEIRGIQSQDGVEGLDAASDAVDAVLHPATPQDVPSASLFTGILIDVQSGSESEIAGDSRVRRRVYDVFAVEASGTFVLSFGPSDVNVAQNKFNLNGHGLNNDDQIRFQNPTAGAIIPSPISPGIWYYVINAVANSFQISLSSGGAAVVILDSGIGTNWIYQQLTV